MLCWLAMLKSEQRQIAAQLTPTAISARCSAAASIRHPPDAQCNRRHPRSRDSHPRSAAPAASASASAARRRALRPASRHAAVHADASSSVSSAASTAIQ